MVALRNPKYILATIDYIMVEQNCVYERKMTLTYRVLNDSDYIKPDKHNKNKREITKLLYENRFPLVSQYNSRDYEELDKSDYYPTKRSETSVVYNVIVDDKEIATTDYSLDARMVVDAIKKFVTINELPESNVQYEEVKITKEKEYEPDEGYTTLMPFVLYEDTSDDLTYRRLDRTMTIHDVNTDNTPDFDVNDASNYSAVETRLNLGKYESQLIFTIHWDAPAKSTKANIEKHLVHMPELLTAKVINQVELLLKEHWNMDEDKTTIDCVTQSNINTKAACSPAVISSLKKRQAEL